MNQQDLERLAARMVSGPFDARLYVRALEAAAVTRYGLELLQEAAEMFEGTAGAVRPLSDPDQVDRLQPGDRLARRPDPDGEEAATDLLDEAAQQLGAALAAGSVPDLAYNLGHLTDARLREQVAASILGLLETLPPDGLGRLQEVVSRWPAPASEPPFLARLADALLPRPEGERGDRLRYAGDRLRDAGALLKAGKEMLHEVAGLLPPGSQDDAPADPLELLGREVAAIVAGEVARFEALESRLAELTRGLDPEGRPLGLVEARLAGLPEDSEGEPSDPAGDLGLHVGDSRHEPGGKSEPRPPWPRRRVSLGQLGRALQRAPERRPTIAAAWEVLSAEDASFARRWAAGVHLCRLTRELVRSDPAQAAAWAVRVGQAAGTLAAASGIVGGIESRMADFLTAFASAHVGNALRVQGHLLVAERFFLPWEEDDQLGLRAEYLALKATLRRVQRRPVEAIALFEEAERIAARGDFPGAGELAAQVRIAHARTLTTISEFEAAAILLRLALAPASPPRAQQELTPRMRWMALQNLADCLSKMGDFEEAGRVLREVDELGAEVSLPDIDLLRTRWIRARVEVRDAWHAGVETLHAVREQLIESGLLYDAALASLELAEWYAEAITGSPADEEHTAAIRELAAESAHFFVGQDISPEALAALVLFQHVASWPAPSAMAFRKIERLLRQSAIS